MILSKTIELFLQSLGRQEEVDFYLKKFRSEDSKYFALIVPDEETLGQVEEVLDFDLEFLLTMGLKPALILPQDAEPPKGKPAAIDLLRIPENRTLAFLVPDWARRVHFLRVAGPLRDASGKALSIVSLQNPPPEGLHPEDQAVFERGRDLLIERPGTHVSICTPLDLLTELFTIKGAGTILRRGSEIHHFTESQEVDLPRLRTLIDESFGKQLKPHFDLGAMAHWYIDSEYRGAALLEEQEAGMYLSKFAVKTAARGEGLAQELWRAITKHPSLFWRARPNNPIHQWYLRQSDGHHRIEKDRGNWNIYWRGIHPAHIPAVIEACASRPKDFIALDT